MDDLKIAKRFYLYRDTPADKLKIFGNGVVQLLEAIRRLGSINLACKELSLSYSKALRIISNCEKELGKEVIIHKKGGFERAGAVITPYGEKLIELWYKFLADCDLLLQNRIEEFIKALGG